MRRALEDLAARPVLREPARSHSKGSPQELLSQTVTVTRRFVDARFAKRDQTLMSKLATVRAAC